MNLTDGDSGTLEEKVSSATDWMESTRSPLLQYPFVPTLWKAFLPCILLLGTFGNVATVVVMRGIKDDNSSHRAILMALAVSDLSLLYVIVLPSWIKTTFNVNLRHEYSAICKIVWWLVYAVNTLSAWLVTAVTVQRTLAIQWPHRIRMLCTWRRTWIVIASVTAVAFAVHVHFLFGMGVSRNECYFEDFAFDFYVHVWHWVDMLISSFLPSVCLLVCDVILSLALFRASAAMIVTSRTVSKDAGAASAHHHEDSRRRKAASRTTVMVLAVSSAFLLLTLPVCVFYLVYGDGADLTNRALWDLLETVAVLMWYSNSAVNFLLYCLTGTKFRTEFLRLVRCHGCKDHSAATSGSGQKTAVIGNHI
ncbi:putative G-protein coupled receptor 139 [Babylonia areolata]|uniref:putative G-protein coupled receptor 139 n=1 Tax=Babylonia areolata TaxID=304850 RepID=UPI003FD0637D